MQINEVDDRRANNKIRSIISPLQLTRHILSKLVYDLEILVTFGWVLLISYELSSVYTQPFCSIMLLIFFKK